MKRRGDKDKRRETVRGEKVQSTAGKSLKPPDSLW